MAAGVVVAVVLMVTRGDDSPDKKSPSESSRSTGSRPTPTLSIPSEVPTNLPSELPSDIRTRLPSDFPTSLPNDLPTLPTGLTDRLDAPGPSVNAYVVP